MRRVIFSALIFVSMLIFCIYTLLEIENVYTQLSNQLEEVEYYIENEEFEKATDEANDFYKMWHTVEERLILVVRHSPLDNITVSTSKMIAFVENKESAEALAELSSIKTILYHIYIGEIPHIYNIL